MVLIRGVPVLDARPPGGWPPGRLALAPLTAAACVLIGACGSAAPGGAPAGRPAGPAAPATANAAQVAVTVTADGCAANPASVPSGPANFTVTNSNAAKVTEIELVKAGDDDILASRENLKPGGSRTFSYRLAAGSYSLTCEGAKNATGPLTVTGSATEPELTDAQKQPADTYRGYAMQQADKLVTTTKTFSTAVRSGDLAAAMNAYGPAHLIYEDIEFVGDHVDDGALDEAIDARQPGMAADDDQPGTAPGAPDDDDNGMAAPGAADPAGWTGFHRLEKMLWGDHTLTGAAPLADKLDSDVAKFRDVLSGHHYMPAELANGAAASLDESLQIHLPGTEDQLSHTGLWDVAGKVESAREIGTVLQPLIAQHDAALAGQVQQLTTTLIGQLTKLKAGDRYVDYTKVSDADRQALIATATQLDDALSKVPAVVV
jgi:iron uptake system component EfeO